MTSRMGIFAFICKKTFMVKEVRSKSNDFPALIHSSLIHFDNPVKIKMPLLSPTMTEGNIARWLKKEGDTIFPGDVLCEIQTNKEIVGFKVEEQGVLFKILIPDNSKNVQLGEVIAIISSEGCTNDVPSEMKVFAVRRPVLKESICIPSKRNEKDMPKLLGPSVRKLLQEYNIHFSVISSSGPQSNILKGDVLKYITKSNIKRKFPSVERKMFPKVVKQLSDSKAFDSSFIDLPISSMRKTIAQRLSESKSTVPHAYISIDCSVCNILKLQRHLKKNGVNISINDFVIKSVACALSENNKVSIVYANGNVIKMQKIDISIAISTENGLITPTVKNVNSLTIQEISDIVKSLTRKAKEGKLHIEELQGGSFTISNLGMFGISEFSAVINPPQAAILAVGTTRLVANKNKPIQKMNITLSYDCRFIEELAAGEFLKTLKAFLENPSNMLF